MRYWRTSPPIGMTWATPGIVSRRGRTVKSAASRTSIADALSLVIATSRIWPMIELIGPICGTMFGGNWVLIRESRSAICCRLR